MDDYYSTNDAAKVLGISRISVFRQIKTGRLKAQKIGRNYIIPKQSILEAIGKSLGRKKKEEIESAVDKAMRDYGETFKLLGKE